MILLDSGFNRGFAGGVNVGQRDVAVARVTRPGQGLRPRQGVDLRLGHPDLAPGTGHFRMPLAEGQALMRDLRGRVSGLCQPTYVLDIPGGHGKSPVGPVYVTDDGVMDPQGQVHAYPPAS